MKSTSLAFRKPPVLRAAGEPRCRLTVLLALTCVAALAWGQEPEHPLEPPDLSSPGATMKTFLESGDAMGAYLAQSYLPSPSRAKFKHLVSLGEVTMRCLDLSEIPPAARRKEGRAAAAALYETLNRIPLPAFDQIPGTNVTHWVVPDTEIEIERLQKGPHEGEYQFSPETVSRAGEFYERVRFLPCVRSVPLKDVHETFVAYGGWLVPHAWIKALPAWFRDPLAGQSAWKWTGLIVVLSIVCLLLRAVYRLSRKGSPQHPVRQALASAALPAFVLAATPVVAYLALVQLNFSGGVGSVIELTASAVLFIAGAWIAWRMAPLLAEAIIASPNIPTESLDAHLIRICARLVGIVAGAALLAIGAGRLGIPVYGIVAGVGVGGLAIALAAQPTIENLIGGLSLFADKPIRVGDLCQYGDVQGTVEAIGIRSTQIRGLDRTVTTVPNALLSKMAVVNLSRRDRMLIQTVIGVRYETSPEQLRYLLAKIRELFVGHPRVLTDPLRVRFIGFGDSSLNIELYAYVTTRDWMEFHGIREDLFLRVMDIVEQSGTGFAFPSQTVYFARDTGLNADHAKAAEEQVRQWREEGRLPFPNLSPEQRPGEEAKRTKENKH